ncbi:laccase-7-like [Aristolochia californica]|uniref:laccase-7-like n=1 Tax=Aristolochia californica TaxID=171875 RepID=UPI0035DEA4F0
MARSFFLLLCALLLSSMASAAVVKHTFHVRNHTVKALCKEQVVVAVNKKFPGPTIHVHEGDTLVVDVFNDSPHNLTIHWHGVFQLLTGWADGTSYVTQCPIRPGNKYTYKFKITGQEGTLWWHAHFSFLRATVYGALVIRPRNSRPYPFPKPYREVPILLGEWWDTDVVEMERKSTASGGGSNVSDAYTINGKPGRLYSCAKDTFKMKVIPGKTYLLRIINAALNTPFFFKLAGHKFIVVGVDASYTNPYHTDVVVVAPGQTTDVLLTADQSPASYYMAAYPYVTSPLAPYDNTTTVGIVQYENFSSSKPIMPVMPPATDTPTAHKFFTNITGLSRRRGYNPVPQHVDERMFITIGGGLDQCPPNVQCGAPGNTRFAASMNNISFQLPSSLSMLEAHFRGVRGIFTHDFPDNPPLVYDYTNATAAAAFVATEKGTRLKKLAYNANVEIVLQNTAVLSTENHPMHLHGFNFFVLAQGLGNFNRETDEKTFNLVNPQERNTIAVPVGGWAVLRFKANNPGVWLIHCHVEIHFPWGLAAAFVVENGNTPASTLPPPPADLPQC